MVLIWALLTPPIILLGIDRKVSGKTIKPDPTTRVSSAPPEPFILGTAGPSPVFLTSYLTAIGDFFSTPRLPEGFEMAKVPTFTDKVSSYFGSFLGLFTGTGRSSVSEAPAPPPPPSAPVDFDFDGDGKSDRARWHASTTEFKVKKSSDGNYLTYTLGSSGAKAAPGDFNGDGNTDACVFLNGTWTYKTSTTASAQTVSFGTTGDIPVAGDYDGDGTTDFAFFRPSTGYWLIRQSSTSTSYSVSFGTSTDIMTPGDYDNDDCNDQAFFRPSTGDWHINGSKSGYYSAHWGSSVDTPVAADYDGDNATDMAVYRPTTGEWFAYKSSTTNGAYLSATWGSWGDQPVPGYYDDDSKADFAIWRPKTGGWYTINSYDSTYGYHLLGVSGDQAVPSAYIRQVGSTVSANDLDAARLSAKNATGGTDLYSRNFSWNTRLVDLRGRSGLDMGLGLSYNSLIWTKADGAMVFDADTSNVSPGFRLGFPVIEPAQYSKAIESFSYMMVTPSGGRVEFRQIEAGNIYETADSSYARLVTTGASSPNDPVEDITIKVTTTDGTQMSYEWKAGAFRCKEIKDRNGNYITITYNDYGGLATITDTLGRVITFNYASGESPSSITQTWKDSNGSGSNVTHTWATFTYTTLQIDTDFSGVTVFGPPDGTTISVLQKITRADGSHSDFAYNSYGQVYKVSNIGADNTSHVLNYVKTNLQSPSSGQTDCPRFTESKTFVENFNSGNEITINNSLTTGQSYSLPGSISGTATKIQVWMSSHPDNLRTNTFVAESGWQEGLPVATEDCITTSSTCSDRKRWTWTDWTQDDTGIEYKLNPRVTENRVGDGTNTRRSTTEYYLFPNTTIAIWGLVKESIVYKADLSSTEKKVFFEYDLNTEYTNRRIIGLPFGTYVYGYDQGTSSLNLVSKTTYAFDEGNFSDSGLSQNISPTQHDNTNYSSSFVTGRGNLTSAIRWDINHPTTSGYAVTSSAKYNTAGSVVSQTDPRGRVTKIFYADDWNDSVSRTTYAYPTTLTDSGGYSSTVEYRFDMGENVWARSPTPYGTGNTYGKTTSRTYDDDHGRVTKEKLDTTGAYTRYVYANGGTTLDTYSTLVDANNDSTINSSDEIRTTTLFDGAGRTRKSRTDNPGSTGEYTGKLTEYDILGRLKRSTVPTEINSSWNPAGDDYRGMDGGNYVWLWNGREYDWKGRVTREINTDNTDRLYTYEGCGCAGGQITTIKGEVTEAIDNQNGGTLQTTKRRTQKVYQDILGRAFKTEIWDLDGGGSTPYSTTKKTFNGRDQATLIRQYAGSDSSSTFQDTTMIYDGHGRVSMTHRPEQFNVNTIPSSPTYTFYTYNADDTVASITDPRDAAAIYTYGHIDDSTSSEYRPLPTKISYSVPGESGIPVPGDITYEYDSAGNRKQMTDDSGTLAYTYDELSRLKTETKTFADTLSNAPSGGYKLIYTYHLTGGIKSIEDPFGAVVTYSADKVGRTTAIGGSGFYDDIAEREITSYTTDIAYRAFGGVKNMTYASTDAALISVGYDNRLRPSAYEAESEANEDPVQSKTYTYNNDSTLKAAVDAVDDKFNRYNDYDFVGRLKRNEFGTASPGPNKPYKQTLGYNEFNNITSRSTKAWDYAAANHTATYENNRKVSGGFNSGTNYYDDAGHVVGNNSGSWDNRYWTYDAAGRVSAWTETAPYVGSLKDIGAYNTYDGDGRIAKRVNRHRDRHNDNTTWSEEPAYYIYSSVTGKKITVTTSTGQKLHTYVYMGGSIIADQNYGTNSNSTLLFKHSDPVLRSEMQTGSDGELSPGNAGRYEPEALGAAVPPEEGEELPAPDYGQHGTVDNPETGCELDYAPIDCRLLGFYTRVLTIDFIEERSERGRGRYKFVEFSRDSVIPYDDPEDDIIRAGSHDEGWELVEIDAQTTPGYDPKSKIRLTESKRRAVFDVNKFKECLSQLFGVEPTFRMEGAPNERTGNESGIGQEDFVGKDSRGREIKIQFDRRYHSKVLSKMKEMMDSQQKGATVWGMVLTKPMYGGVAYVASNVPDAYLLPVKIHEIGNGLAQETGHQPTPGNVALLAWDIDPGMALEECTYGGKVAPNGFMYDAQIVP